MAMITVDASTRSIQIGSSLGDPYSTAPTTLLDDDRRLDACVAKLTASVEERKLANEREADELSVDR
ncbi:hypothetical protein [Candidatus Poriferisodalis sp.]|uniref:hypothetical protein n=1 Tax=Candidatus Poriferisodalis sp. TaxID=3101277 RepID=UPI003B024AD0